ncbi:hypothetical protein C9374_010504 [Naegleria lovaniensis]|uniref:F-box domain-containing protein n=1 Tax=Naegleria lovaniensis TaxID=51637 RepID=A0AA88GBR8_NAELO|nr:uncharacterized protein C9374_010504 [Naegleria lovaniensis]KAG2374760.1 hypothetical protein C9374_010504 [Naegleria lovaniensis]
MSLKRKDMVMHSYDEPYYFLTQQPADKMRKTNEESRKETTLSKLLSDSNNCSFSQHVPNELLLSIFEYLNGCELLKNISKVCRNWFELVSNELDWKLLVQRRLGFEPIIPDSRIIEQHIRSHYRPIQSVKQETTTTGKESGMDPRAVNSFWKRYFIEKVAKFKYLPWQQQFIHSNAQNNSNSDLEEEESKNTKMKNDGNKSTIMIHSPVHNCRPCMSFTLESFSSHYYQPPNFKRKKYSPSRFFWETPPCEHMGPSLLIGEEYLAVGESKIGGCPDLPRNFEWPKCSDVPKSGGMLYFFCPLDETSTNGESYWAVRKEKDPQPMIYLSAQRIRELGGLERRALISKEDQKKIDKLSKHERPCKEKERKALLETLQQYCWCCAPSRMIISSKFLNLSTSNDDLDYSNMTLFSAEDDSNGHSAAEETHEASFIKMTIDSTSQSTNTTFLYIRTHERRYKPFHLSQLQSIMGIVDSTTCLDRDLSCGHSFDSSRLYVSVGKEKCEHVMKVLQGEFLILTTRSEPVSRDEKITNEKYTLQHGSEFKKPMELSRQDQIIFLPFAIVKSYNLEGRLSKHNNEFLYRIESEEEYNFYSRSCEYLNLQQTCEPILHVWSLNPSKLRVDAGEERREQWNYYLPYYCFEKGVIEKSYVNRTYW